MTRERLQLPLLEDYIAKVAPTLGRIPSKWWKPRLEAIIKNGKYIKPQDAQPLIRSLRALAARAHKYADQLEAALPDDDER